MAISRWVDSALASLDERLESTGKKQGLLASVLLAPALILLGVFGVAPLFYAGYLSLYRIRDGQALFVGLGHYIDALSSSVFWDSFLVTIYHALGVVPATMAISFLIARGLSNITALRSALRTFYFLPYITSIVAAAMVWRTLVRPDLGVLNHALGLLGLSPQQWLLEPRGILHLLSDGYIAPDIGPSLALCVVILFEIWHNSGFMIVVMLAGLSAMPRELEDAARVDGAGSIRVLLHVVLPSLSPILFFLGVVGAIGSFQAFNSFYALTGNGRGPLDTTQNMTIHIYTSFYEQSRWGYGAAVAILLCVFTVGLTALQWRVLGRKASYR